MSRDYVRPLVQCDLNHPSNARSVAGGWGWFTHVELLRRGRPPQVVPADDAKPEQLSRISRMRPAIAGLSMARPHIMGILNVTPDSFSDGGKHTHGQSALSHAHAMVTHGAAIIDVGGESTRPGAALVPESEEIERIAPTIAAVRDAGITVPISIDTRKASVAEAALQAGATIVNDVSGFTFDADLAPHCAKAGVPVCVMHAQGDPSTMQQDPRYDDVLLDVFDYLESRVEALAAQGIARDQIIVDPGIGFGKTLAHNLALLNRISLFHSLGAPILLGTSRKRFIGTIGNAPQADTRAPGSIATALAAIAQGIQIVRVHDVADTAQALALWSAVQAGEFGDG